MKQSYKEFHTVGCSLLLKYNWAKAVVGSFIQGFRQFLWCAMERQSGLITLLDNLCAVSSNITEA